MSPDQPLASSSHGPGHNKAAWVTSVVLAVVFIPMGAMKLMGSEMAVEMFQQWGYALWFMYLIGVLEVAAGIAVLIPRVATYAAGYLTVQMLGALVTHVVHTEWLFALLPIVMGALAIYTMFARIPDAAGATPARRPMRA